MPEELKNKISEKKGIASEENVNNEVAMEDNVGGVVELNSKPAEFVFYNGQIMPSEVVSGSLTFKANGGKIIG